VAASGAWSQGYFARAVSHCFDWLGHVSLETTKREWSVGLFVICVEGDTIVRSALRVAFATDRAYVEARFSNMLRFSKQPVRRTFGYGLMCRIDCSF
jgi:hypothetical protein